MSAHKWQFASRFRRHAFGWRSDTPVQRIKEAIIEIKQVARNESGLAAEGAITLLEKFSPALEQITSGTPSRRGQAPLSCLYKHRCVSFK